MYFFSLLSFQILEMLLKLAFVPIWNSFMIQRNAPVYNWLKNFAKLREYIKHFYKNFTNFDERIKIFDERIKNDDERKNKRMNGAKIKEILEKKIKFRGSVLFSEISHKINGATLSAASQPDRAFVASKACISGHANGNLHDDNLI